MSSHSVLFMQHFSKMDTQGESCPKGRSSHAAVCLGYGGDHPQLLVTGGYDSDGVILNDVWMLDVQSGRWREVRVCVCKCIVNSILHTRVCI